MMSKPKSKKRSTFIRLIQLILPYKGLILFSLICMVGFNIFTAAPVYYAKDIVDGIVYGDKPELKQYFLVGLGLIIVFGLKGIFFFGQNYSIGYLVQRLITRLRQRLFHHMVGLSFSFFSRSSVDAGFNFSPGLISSNAFLVCSLCFEYSCSVISRLLLRFWFRKYF